jgi:hypothetical protein
MTMSPGHEHLLFDLFALEDFHADGRILNTNVVAGCVDGDLVRFGRLQFDLDHLFPDRVNVEGG